MFHATVVVQYTKRLSQFALNQNSALRLSLNIVPASCVADEMYIYGEHQNTLRSYSIDTSIVSDTPHGVLIVIKVF